MTQKKRVTDKQINASTNKSILSLNTRTSKYIFISLCLSISNVKRFEPETTTVTAFETFSFLFVRNLYFLFDEITMSIEKGGEMEMKMDWENE